MTEMPQRKSEPAFAGIVERLLCLAHPHGDKLLLAHDMGISANQLTEILHFRQNPTSHQLFNLMPA